MKEIVLKNESKLIIRTPEMNDAEQIIHYLNRVGGESDYLLFGKNEFHLSVEEEKNYIKNVNDNPNSYMILGQINDEIVSIAAIHRNGRKRISHNSHLAISVRKDFWRMGIGNTMMTELIDFARNNQIKIISLGVYVNNTKAIQLYEKLGFKQIGVHKDYFYINDEYIDEILMDLYL